VVRLSLGKFGAPPSGTAVNGTMARATLAAGRQTLDRTRGGRNLVIK
jgi:hypothetical protein